MASDGSPSRRVDAREWAEQLPDIGDAVRAEFGPDAARRFSEELFHFQRHRAFLYATVMALFIAPFFVFDLWSALDATKRGGDGGLIDSPDLTDPIIDGVLILFHAVFAAVFQRLRGSRERLMRLFLGLLMGVGSAIVLYTWWATRGPEVIGAGDRGTWMEPFVFGATAIFCTGFAHLFASLFVALSPREALIPVIPITIAYILTMLTLIGGPPVAKVWMIAAWPLAAAPGLVWCTWRYRSFVDRFRWGVLRTKLGDLRQDLADARRVHEALFPPPIADGPLRFSYEYEPMRDIGGDYLFARRRADGRVIVVLVDVVGHGVAAALAANRVHGELERLMEDRPEASPGETLEWLNRFFVRSLSSQGIFATAIAMELSPAEPSSRTARLRWANAGHPAGILLRTGGRIEHCHATAVMLGVCEPAAFAADERETSLAAGEAIVACTDGVHEATSTAGAYFGDERLMQVVADARIGGPDRVAPALVEEVRRYRDGDARDDVLVATLWRPG